MKIFEYIHRIDDREYWDSFPERIKSGYIRRGEKYLDFAFLSIPASSFLAFSKDGNRVINENVEFEKRVAITALTLGECFENKGRFVTGVLDGIWSICEESTWEISAHINLSKCVDGLPVGDALGIYSLETAQIISYCTYVLQKRLDCASKAVALRVYEELETRIYKPFLEIKNLWWMGYNENDLINNWNPWCIRNITVSAMLLSHGDMLEKILQKSRLCISRFYNAYPNDGVCVEGTSYWAYSVGCYVEAMSLLDESVFKDEKLKKMISFISDMHISKDYFVNFADGGARLKDVPYFMLYFCGKQLGDNALSHKARELYSDFKILDDEKDIFRIQAKLECVRDIENASSKTQGSDFSLFEKSQIFIGRESKRGLFVAAKGGNNNESHNHNDVGSFIIYKNGNPVCIDPGVEVYTKKTFGPDRYKIWTMQSMYHNLPFAEDSEQQAGERFRAKSFKCENTEDKLTFFADLSEAYSGGSFMRKIELLRKKGKVIVRDKINRTGAEFVGETLMLSSRPIISGYNILVGDSSINVSCDNKFNIMCEELHTADPNLLFSYGDTIYVVRAISNTDNCEFEIIIE